MSIDPRVMKQLLQLQMQPRLNLFPTANGSSVEPESDFAALLSQLMDQADTVKEHAKPAPSFRVRSNMGLNPLANPTAYEPIIRQAASQFGVQARLIQAVIHAESSFNAHAVSKAGAKGLMQLMDATGRSMGVTDPFDPEQNIMGGTRYLAGLLRKYSGNEAVALAAYNAGPGRIDRLGIRTDADLRAKFELLPKETQHYVDKVLSLKNRYPI